MKKWLLCCLITSSCHSVSGLFSPSQKEKKSLEEKEQVIQRSLAEILQRMDSLESSLLEQKSKLLLLEQGVRLGLTPQVPQTEHPSNPPKSLPRVTESSKKEDNLKEKLAQGKALFEKKKYAHAYLIFSDLEKNYTPKEHAEETSYWIGRCWFQLGEWEQAKNFFDRASRMAEDPSTRTGARIYLARTQLKLGLKTQASQNLEGVLRQEPEDSAYAKSARDLLRHMVKEL
jgi:TolA-binding protein